jgi:tRNA dimethylallyltransferase
MSIGTAKPDAATLAQAPHHLIDMIPPTQVYSAANFRNDALRLMTDITARGKIPLLVGGTMLYFNALQSGLSNLPEANPEVRARLDEEAALIGWPAMHEKLAIIDPETAARLEPTDAQRVQRALEVCELSGKPMSALYQETEQAVFPYNLLKIAIVPSDRKVLHERIAMRFEQMMAQGFLDEVRTLLKTYPSLTADTPSMRCVGYRQALEYLHGECDLAELKEKGIAATRQLAKRQLTWLRGMDDTREVDCLSPDLYSQVKAHINNFINT